MALPFLPWNEIAPAFDKLKESLHLGCDARLTDLFDYFSRNWMNSTTWSPQSWSVYNETVRTNNDVEGMPTSLRTCSLLLL
jgi:hypothetical protein